MNQGKYVSNTYLKTAGVNAMAMGNHKKGQGGSQAKAIQLGSSNRDG
jgi:hypothetical protein